MRRDETPRHPAGPEDPGPVERFVLVFVHEPMLWPVLLVAIGHAVALVTALLLLALRERRVSAIGGLLAVAFLSVSALRLELRRRGRPGALSAIGLSTWLLSGAAALAADRYGAF